MLKNAKKCKNNAKKCEKIVKNEFFQKDREFYSDYNAFFPRL